MPSKIQSQAIFLSFVPLAFLLVFLGLVAVLVDRSAELTNWTDRATRILDRSDRILKTLGDANRAAVEYTNRPRPQALAAFRLAASDLAGQSRELVQLVDEPSQKKLAEQYARATANVTGVLSKYLADLRSGHALQARALVASPATRAMASAFQMAKATFDSAERQLTGTRFRALRGEVQTYGYILLVTTFAAIVLTLLTTARFGIRIADRLQQLAQNANRLGSGLPATPVAGDDEIADLDRIYREMAQRIRETLTAYQREHYISSTLQRSLLPQELPRVPGLRIDTAYSTAADAADIGGDWYDVFKLDDQTIAFSVGDVAGHGLRAAAIMGSVRQSIRTAARVDAEPWSVLKRANRALCADEDVVVTAFYAVLDLRDGRLRYSVAGHPLPLVIRADGEVEQLQGEGLILGVDTQARFTTYEADLRAGEALVGFTDGIVEIERDYFKGMNDLIAAVKAEYARPSSGNIAEAIRDRVLARAEPLDDSAILFIGVTNVGTTTAIGEKTWTVDARQKGAAHRVRRAVVWDLAESVTPESDLPAVELIVGELLSNVARHTPGQAEVTLQRVDGSARLRVCDSGKPFSVPAGRAPEPLAPGGRGLRLVQTLSRDFEIANSGDGNCVSVLLPVRVKFA